MEHQYRGHEGLHSLWIDLENIINDLERNRRYWTKKETINELRELNANLFTLQQEWFLESRRSQPVSSLDDLLRKLD